MSDDGILHKKAEVLIAEMLFLAEPMFDKYDVSKRYRNKPQAILP